VKSKYNYVGCQIDDDEFKILSALVMQSGCSSRSEFIRQRIFQKPETDISNKILLEKNLDMESDIKDIKNDYKELMKKLYVIHKISVATLVELTKREYPNYKDIITELISVVEKEAGEAYGS